MREKVMLLRLGLRLQMAAGAALYAALFWLLYLNWLNPLWGYWGFTYRHVPVQYLLASWALALLPCAWLPVALSRPSQLIYWVMYLIVYLPTMFVAQFMHLRSDFDVLVLLMTLATGFYLMGLGYRLRLHSFSRIRLSPLTFWFCFTSIAIFFCAILLLAFHGEMNLASLDNIYDQRAAAKLITAGSFIGYPLTLLSGMIDPVFMAFGLVEKRWRPFIAGAFGQVLVYACAANKSVITSIVVMPLFYLLLKRRRDKFGPTMISLSILVFVGLFLLHPKTTSTFETSGLSYAITSLVLMRTVGGPALLNAQYHDFFATHPLTYMSHVTGFNWFIHYPYSDSLGYVVGAFFRGATDLNANANLWATDGIAGLGLPGVLLISLLCGGVFWMLDSLAQRRDIVFAGLTVVFAALNLCNVSLFTSLISGGLLPLMGFFYLMPDTGTLQKQERSPSTRVPL